MDGGERKGEERRGEERKMVLVGAINMRERDRGKGCKTQKEKREKQTDIREKEGNEGEV